MSQEVHQAIIERLQTPRQVPQTTLSHIATRVEVAGDELAPLIDSGCKGLDEFEVEEHFAALFTPLEEDKRALTPVLAGGPLDDGQLKQAIVAVRDAAPSTPLEFENGQTATFPPNPWLLERFVRLLRMEHAPDVGLCARVNEYVPDEHRIEVLTACRERALSDPEPRGMLMELLRRWKDVGAFEIETFRFLVSLIVQHKLRSLESLGRTCSELEMTYRKETLHLESGDNPVIKGWKRSPRAGKGDLKRRDDDMIALRRRQLEYLAVIQMLLQPPTAAPAD